MSAPPLLLGSALLFWGAQAGLFPLACAAAAALEARPVLPWRWDLAGSQLNRISDLCALFFASIVIYFYATSEPAAAIMKVIQWVPLAVWPMAAAQAYGTAGRVDLGAFFMFLRRPSTDAEPRLAIDVSYPYLMICLLAASAANVRTAFFYQGFVLLSAWALWKVRPAGRSALAWPGLLALAAALGLAGHLGLHSLQRIVETMATDFVFGRAAAFTDPYLSRTAMGRIGALKQSDEILLRVRPAAGRPPPALLREAAYSRYNAAQWYAQEGSFGAVVSDREGVPSVLPWQAVGISGFFPGGSGLLALPQGTFQVGGLPAAALSRNRFGAMRLEAGASTADYEAAFDPAASSDSPPDARDLDIPSAEGPTLRRLAGELRLSSRRPRQAMTELAGFFEKGFRYSIYQESSLGRPLEHFLLRTRSGHCEFFATATVLLLRAAGIPARYATGYSVQEFSRLEGSFIVRQRHAHAWALVYADGAWRELDTTPGVWAQVEAARASRWQPLRDLGAWLSHRFSRWRWGRWPAGRRVLLLLPFFVVLAWKLSQGLEAARVRPNRPGPVKAVAARGGDSELYAIEVLLARSGLGRRLSEPMSVWARRVGEGLPVIVSLHDRYRFSRPGLDAEDRAALRAAAAAWLEARERRLRA